MRLHRWIGPFVGALAAIVGSESGKAQDAFFQTQGSMPGSAAVGAYGNYPPPNTGAFPGYYQPWPGISPYQPDYGQTLNEGGLWQYDNMSDSGLPAHWRLRTEYIRVGVKLPEGYIGNPNAPTYKEQILPVLQAAPYSLPQTALQGFQPVNGAIGFNFYDPVVGSEFDTNYMNGLRLTLEALNTDGTGLQLIGSMATDRSTEFNAKDQIHPSRGGIPEAVTRDYRLQLINFYDPQQIINAGGPQNISSVVPIVNLQNQGGQGGGGAANQGTLLPVGRYRDISEVLQDTVLNLRGIPLDDGTVQRLPDGTVIGGANALFDLDYSIRFKVDQYQAGLRWNAMPIVKTSWLRVNPTFGVRYMALREEFAFFGRRSGLAYDNLTAAAPVNPDVLLHSVPNFTDENRDNIFDNAGQIEGGTQGGGGGGGGGGTGTGRFIYVGNPALYPLSTVVNNIVKSQLIGPEVGLAYEVGGDSLHVGGRTSFGLLANFERFNLSGDNLAAREADLIVPTGADPRPNDFTDEGSSSHISPMIEQSIYFEGPFLKYVPIIRRSAIARNANVNVGYTHTFIAEISRPDETINWQSAPAAGLFPTIRNNRSKWYTNTFNLGVGWQW